MALFGVTVPTVVAVWCLRVSKRSRHNMVLKHAHKVLRQVL
jgi:hypothetical protein